MATGADMKGKRRLAVASFGHFLVDFFCVYLMLYIRQPEAVVWYNTLAFGLQPVIGILLDMAGETKDRELTRQLEPKGNTGQKESSKKLRKNRKGIGKEGLALGIIGVGGILFLLGKQAVPFGVLALFLGVGNAFYHVVLGREVLQYSNRKLLYSGMFVSTGAVGVSLGGFLALFPVPFVWILGCWCVLAFFVAAGLFWTRPVTEPEALPGQGRLGKSEPLLKQGSLTKKARRKESVLRWESVLLLFSIWVRSCGSFLVATPARPPVSGSGLGLGVVAFCYLYSGVASGLGKALGGVLLKKGSGAGFLLLSAPFLMFGQGSVWLICLGLVLFQMNMPVTLCLLAERLPGREGFAFGLTTAALLGGYFACQLFPLADTASIAGRLWFLLLTVLSAGGLFWVARSQTGRKEW